MALGSDVLTTILPFAGGTGLGLFGAVVIAIGYRKFTEETGAANLVRSLTEELDRLAKGNKELAQSVHDLQNEVINLRTENIELRTEIQQLRAQLSESPVCMDCPHRPLLRRIPPGDAS